MKVQRRPARPRRAAIDIVADNRPSHFGAVDAQLMRTAGQWLEREPRDALSAAHHLPSAGRWKALASRLHPPAAGLVALWQRNIDPGPIGARAASDPGSITIAESTRA